jgi:hypothetical protein
MGLRKDNRLWTVPGGHFEEGETPQKAALRELMEETGIKVEPHEMKFLGSQLGGMDNSKEIFMFRLDLPTGYNIPRGGKDPDEESHGWHLIDVAGGLPAGIKASLHVPADRNYLLQRAGLLGEGRKSLARMSSISSIRAKQYGPDLMTELHATFFHQQLNQFKGEQVDQNTSGRGKTLGEVSASIRRAGKKRASEDDGDKPAKDPKELTPEDMKQSPENFLSDKGNK